MTVEKFFETMSKAGMKVRKVSDGLIFKKMSGSKYALFYLRAGKGGKAFLYYFVNNSSVFCSLDDVRLTEDENGCQLRFDRDVSVLDAEPPKGICSRELGRLMRKSARQA